MKWENIDFVNKLVTLEKTKNGDSKILPLTPAVEGILRSDWHEEDKFPKYVEVSGSKPSPAVYGVMSKPVIIVESELDAILLQQKASDLIGSIAFRRSQ